MALLVFSMNQTLDGYVDFRKMSTSPVLFRHFIEKTRMGAGCLYGRMMYEAMRFWDQDVRNADQLSLGTDRQWDIDRQNFSEAWRGQHKWVVSTTMQSVGPNATLISSNVDTFVRKLKETVEGEISVSGPALAQSLGTAGLIDEYRIYVHPVVAGEGKPYFAAPLPPMRLIGNEVVDENVIRLSYAPT